MNVLILGGGGFIGSHLVKYYLKKNCLVYVIDNFITGNKKNLEEIKNNSLFRLIEADLIDFNYKNLPSFDIIYDLASPASPAFFEKLSFEIIKVNSIGLMAALDFFIKSKSKVFVFSSTSEVYGDPLVSPQKENYFGNVNTTGSRSCYDESKRFAETIIYSYFKKYNIDVRIARIFNTYGPFMNKNDGRFISNFINQAINNQDITVYGNGSQTRSPCYISDMIDGLVKLGETKNLKGEVINLGNPEEKKVIEIAIMIKKMTNSKSKIIFLPIDKDDPKKRCPDISKAKKLLNWQPKISLKKGLEMTINYFKNL